MLDRRRGTDRLLARDQPGVHAPAAVVGVGLEAQTTRGVLSRNYADSTIVLPAGPLTWNLESQIYYI